MSGAQRCTKRLIDHGRQTSHECGAPILWLTLDTGKRHPVDHRPDPAGRVAAWRDVAGHWVGHVLKADEHPDPGTVLHVTHFATCPVIEQEARLKREAKIAEKAPNVVTITRAREARTAREQAILW